MAETLVISQLWHTKFICNKIPGFFLSNPPFFIPRGFRKSPRRFFFAIFQQVRPENLVTSQLEHSELIFIKIPGYFWRNPPFFTPRGFRKSPRRFFLLFFNRVGLKIWLQVNQSILNSYSSRSQSFSGGTPLFSPPGVSENPPRRVFLLFFSRVGLKIWLQVNYGILNSYP